MPRPDRYATVISDLLPVIVNRHGGAASAAGEKLADRIEAAFAAVGREVEIRFLDGRAVADAVAALSDWPLVVIGGGDGTIGCAAQARLGNKGTLAILPLGTRNHLARELGIPLDLEGAVSVAAGESSRRIDVATVNGAVFVNNASVGFYPLLVRWRDAESRRLPKWLATISAGWAALRQLRHHRMHLQVGESGRAVRTPILFVGNNRYVLEPGRIGQRTALDDGVLSVFAVSARSRIGFVWFAVRTFLGLGDPSRDFAALGECDRLTVYSRSRAIDIALDGEVRRMAPPLQFELLPHALKVRTRHRMGSG